MNSFQKVVKYLAIALAISLSIAIVNGILGAAYIVLHSTNLIKSDEKFSNVKFNEYSSYLDIDLSVSSLIIKKGDSFRYESNFDNLTFEQEGNKLIIKDNGKNVFNVKDNTITLYVPSDLVFEKVNINMGIGKLDINDVNLSNAYINLGVGKAYIESSLLGDSTIKCGVGKLDLVLSLSKDDYSIKVNKGLGVTRINNDSISDNIQIGDGINKIYVNGGVGEINIKTK